MHAVVVIDHALAVTVVVLHMGAHAVERWPAVIDLRAVVAGARVATQLTGKFMVVLQALGEANVAIADEALDIGVVIIAIPTRARASEAPG